MSNITMSVDSELVREARKIAIDRNSSLNELVRQFLVDMVTKETMKREMIADELNRLFQQAQARVGPLTWSREDLHER